ncbi:MAG: response regulator [Nitrososphaerales archaeon]
MQRQSRILLVDDNPTNLAILEEMLGDEYRWEAATSGEEALEIAPDFQPDLILLDVMMPGINGYETCRRIRANPALRNVKIVMVSAKALVSERLEGYDAGADDYLTKPFDEEELLAKVRVYLSREQMKREIMEMLRGS